MHFLSKIISLPPKTPKTGSFLKDSCSTMVVYWIAVQFVRVQASYKSGFICQLVVFAAVTGNKWFVVNQNWRHLCFSCAKSFSSL